MLHLPQGWEKHVGHPRVGVPSDPARLKSLQILWVMERGKARRVKRKRDNVITNSTPHRTFILVLSIDVSSLFMKYKPILLLHPIFYCFYLCWKFNVLPLLWRRWPCNVFVNSQTIQFRICDGKINLISFSFYNNSGQQKLVVWDITIMETLGLVPWKLWLVLESNNGSSGTSPSKQLGL